MSTGELHWLDHLVVAVYMLGMMAMGIKISRRQESTSDFFTAGRSLPSWAVGISLLASLLSTITYLAMPGEMFRTGLAFLTRQLGVPFVLIVVWFVWLPFFMKLELTSAYEYLEKRFSYATRCWAAVFCLCLLLGWMAVVVLTASNAMVEISNLQLGWFFGVNGDSFRDADMHAVILGIGIFSVIYTTLGGIRAVVWTDVIQFFVLIGGALFAVFFVAMKTSSGLGDWIATASEYPHRESVEWFSWDIGKRSTVFSISIGMFFWFICTHGSNQVALQRYFTLNDARQARRSYLISALSSFGLGVVLACVGVAVIHYIGSAEIELPAEADLLSADEKVRHTAQDRIFPQFIRFFLPAGLRGLVIAALFAAAMSTIDSGANSVATIVTVDFVRPRLGKIGDTTELRMARFMTAGMGIIIVITTVALYHMSKGSDIISLMQKGFNCFLGPLGALFVLAMFCRRCSAKSALPALFIGEAFGITASYSEELFNLKYSTHLVVPGSWLVTIVAGYGLARLLSDKATEKQQQWMWREVTAGSKKRAD